MSEEIKTTLILVIRLTNKKIIKVKNIARQLPRENVTKTKNKFKNESAK